MKKLIGIDLHSNNSVVVVTDEEDRVIFQKRMPNDLKLIELALAQDSDFQCHGRRALWQGRLHLRCAEE